MSDKGIPPIALSLWIAEESITPPPEDLLQRSSPPVSPLFSKRSLPGENYTSACDFNASTERDSPDERVVVFSPEELRGDQEERRKTMRREQQRRRRALETFQQKKKRQDADAAAHRVAKEKETEEQSRIRREKNAAAKRNAVNRETQQEAERRRGIYREYQRLNRSTKPRKEEIRQLHSERKYSVNGRGMYTSDGCKKKNRVISYTDAGVTPKTVEEIKEMQNQHIAYYK